MHYLLAEVSKQGREVGYQHLDSTQLGLPRKPDLRKVWQRICAQKVCGEPVMRYPTRHRARTVNKQSEVLLSPHPC